MIRRFTWEWFDGFLDGAVVAVIVFGCVVLIASASRPGIQAWRSK